MTILVINKTTTALTSAIALANLSLPATAQVYSYSQASLTSIAHPSDAAITSGSLSYTFPGYSAVLFVVQPAATPAATTTTTLSASATQINAGQAVTFSVAVAAGAGSTPSGTVTLLDGSATLGTSSLANGAATFTITSLAAGTHSITASYAGDAADETSTSSAVSVQVNAAAPLQTTAVTLAASAATAVSGQAITLTATVAPTSATGAITFKDGTTSIGTAPLAAGERNACRYHVERRNPLADRCVRWRCSGLIFDFQHRDGDRYGCCRGPCSDSYPDAYSYSNAYSNP